MPLVSVIIPTYNRSALLEEAVRSVCVQTCRDMEIIVADDGSFDETAGVLRRLKKESCSGPGTLPFIFLRQDHRGMPGQVRNFAAASASGEYLAFLDCDDLWKPGKLARQLAFFQENPDLLISHTREIWLREGKEVSQKGQKHRRQGDVFEDALDKCIIGPSTVMMKRSLYEEFGGFREDLEIAEDYEFWLRITAAHPVGYLDEPLTVKRAGDWDQLSTKYGYIEIFRIQALRGLVDRSFFPGAKDITARKVLSRKCDIHARGCRKRDRISEAERYEALAKQYHS